VEVTGIIEPEKSLLPYMRNKVKTTPPRREGVVLVLQAVL
jgi:hypothetical protein